VAQKKKLERETTLGKPVDAFQSAADQRLETYGRKLEGKGRPILYGLLALLAVAIVGGIVYSYSQRSASAAQTALGKAIEIQTAAVISGTPAPGNQDLTFQTDKERAEKAIAAFEEVAAKYGSSHKEKAQYFIAVNRLKLDRPAGIQELENLSKNGTGEVAALSKFALAEAKFSEGKYDEAANLYDDVLKAKSGIFADETINYALAQTYEKQGKTQEAAEMYFNLVKAAREAKDPDGEPLQQTQTAREAATKLEKLAPGRYAQLPPEATSSKTLNF
jgi:tetratricopeptide (TPR) repeat protein